VLALAQVNMRAAIRWVPGRGKTFVPGARYVSRKEGYSSGRFNSHGFRDRERTWEKAAGVTRMVVLGDSYVEALQVELDEAFPALLEDRLNAAEGQGRYEVLALGQSGFGTVEDLVRYRAFGKAYRPDVVLLAVTTSNDFRDNQRTLNRERIGYYGVLDPGGGLGIDDTLVRAYEGSLTWPRRAYQTIRRHSFLVSLVSERLALLGVANTELAGAGAHADPEAVSRLDPLADLNVYRQDAGPLWDEAFEITRRSVMRLRDEVRADGGELVMVALTNAEQVHPEIAQGLEDRYGALFDWQRPNRFLAGVAEEGGVPFLDLVPVLAAWHRESGEYLHGFGARQSGHWNQAGHRLAAKAIGDFLLQAGLVPRFSPEPPVAASAPGPQR
jgi:hypothetical protein